MVEPELFEASELTKASSYTRVEIEAYDKYRDATRVEKTFIADAKIAGKAEGDLARTIALVLKIDDMDSDVLFISQALSITEKEIFELLPLQSRLTS